MQDEPDQHIEEDDPLAEAEGALSDDHPLVAPLGNRRRAAGIQTALGILADHTENKQFADRLRRVADGNGSLRDVLADPVFAETAKEMSDPRTELDEMDEDRREAILERVKQETDRLISRDPLLARGPSLADFGLDEDGRPLPRS